MYPAVYKTTDTSYVIDNAYVGTIILSHVTIIAALQMLPYSVILLPY